jgi:hypothetical protein
MEFTINGVRWKLKHVNSKNNVLRRTNGTLTFGVTDWNMKTIFISDAISGDFYEHVLCHELTHALCFVYNIYLPIETEEWLCNFMETHGKEIIYLLDDLLGNEGRRIFA